MSNKYVRFTSPRGTAKYPRVDQPYTYNKSIKKSVPDPNGGYEMKLVMEPADFAPFKKAIDTAVKEAKVTPEFMPYKKEVDKDTGEPTGKIEIVFKAYGKEKDGRTRKKIKFFDAKGKPMPSNFPLTAGSVVKVNGYMSISDKSARLNMDAIQIISLVERAPVFEEEDGFTYDGELDDEVTNNNKNNETSQDTDDEDFDF